jgi:FkbM family methyltransferase
MKWRVGSTVHGCWLGTYEPAKQAVVRELLKPGMNVIDVGANAGFYTLAFSALAKHVWAVEPFASNIASLSQHIRINGRDNVTVIQAAVADRQGMVHFQSGGSNSVGKLTKDITSLLVPTVTLDGLIDSGVPVPDLVKIDIEGAELDALRGAERLLSMRRTTWLIALDSPEDQEACRALLKQHGYTLRDIGNPNEIVAS